MTKKNPINYFRVFFFLFLSIILYKKQFFLSLYPWLLLWTPFREETMKAWRKYAPINNAIVYPLRPIPEIQAVGIISFLSVIYFFISFLN